MRSRFLDELDLPYIEVTETGEIYDHIEGRYRYPQRNGQFEIVSKLTKRRTRCDFDQLLRYCFDAPWNQQVIIPFRHLSVLGFVGYYVLEDGRVFSAKTMQYMNGSLSFDGYRRVCFSNGRVGLGRTEIVHRLVAKMFLPNPENKPEVNHIDGNKLNNHVSNLEWVFPYENMEHALRCGLRKSALTDEQIHEICRQLESGERVSTIYKTLNIQKHSVLDIKSGCHMRISSKYNIPRNRHFSE